jgi:hypothetical protein
MALGDYTIEEEVIVTDRHMYFILGSCPLCRIDFTIKTRCYGLSEIIGTLDIPVHCPLCKNEAIVDDKEDEYI